MMIVHTSLGNDGASNNDNNGPSEFGFEVLDNFLANLTESSE